MNTSEASRRLQISLNEKHQFNSHLCPVLLICKQRFHSNIHNTGNRCKLANDESCTRSLHVSRKKTSPDSWYFMQIQLELFKHLLFPIVCFMQIFYINEVQKNLWLECDKKSFRKRWSWCRCIVISHIVRNLNFLPLRSFRDVICVWIRKSRIPIIKRPVDSVRASSSSDCSKLDAYCTMRPTVRLFASLITVL